MKKSNETKSESIISTLQVKRAHECKDGTVLFDVVVNGITLYGCAVRESKKGENFVCFPQKKGKDGNYYNHVWFPITKEDTDKIVSIIEDLLKED